MPTGKFDDDVENIKFDIAAPIFYFLNRFKRNRSICCLVFAGRFEEKWSKDGKLKEIKSPKSKCSQ